jgi:tRNA threonylcarbamoyl adenosine modification protein YjeE
MTSSLRFPDLNEGDVARLADEVAFLIQPGDSVCLEGDLGAGKSTFARALIRALMLDPAHEVPSPTYTLMQTYEAPRFEVAHFDLYRLADPRELDELGFESALTRGVAVIEWPAQGGNGIPSDRLTLRFDETASADHRTVTISASPALDPRLERFAAIRSFLANSGWGEAATRLTYLQGDASPRRYARLSRPDGTRAILMDSPARPDGPPVEGGKSYSAVAHLAEDVHAFVAVAGALSKAGVSAPLIFAEDLKQGLLLIEDLGDQVLGAEVARGRDQAALWRRAVDALIALQRHVPPSRFDLSDGSSFHLPEADAVVLEIETRLLIDWYWPALHGAPPPQTARDSFKATWRPIFERVLKQPKTWLLRDYHSPNLIALDARTPPRDIGIIDFQDAMLGPATYDLVSLLQDARIDVAEALEKGMLDHYIGRVAERERAFDADEFRIAYAALGAQRNTKILGIFARLAMRDGKRRYLAHLPRIWGYLERDLQHPSLDALRAWYDQNLPRGRRSEALKI